MKRIALAASALFTTIAPIAAHAAPAADAKKQSYWERVIVITPDSV